MSRIPKTQRLIVILLVVSGGVTFTYVGVSICLAMILAYQPPLPITQTPASFGLRYQLVDFPSREDHVPIRGWLIPGLLPGGCLALAHTVIVVHGMHSNRATPLILNFCQALAHQGFALLSFDMRGQGQSAPAPLGGGYFEQRDVLGAVDFLRSGQLPYPELERPISSMGGAFHRAP